MTRRPPRSTQWRSSAASDVYKRQVLPGFKVYESVANFILIKYPIELKEALQKAFAEQSYKVKFMNEPDINTHLRITLGRPEQNRIVIDTIKEIASK